MDWEDGGEMEDGGEGGWDGGSWVALFCVARAALRY